MKCRLSFYFFLSLFAFTNILDAGALHKVTLTRFQPDNGQIMPTFEVAYRIFGKINRDSTNIVIFPTWFGGKTSHIGKVVGQDKLIDTTRYAVIAIAAPGNGESETPVSLDDVFKGNFPELSIADFVRSQRRMLSEHLGIKHVKALIGGSMGGMQVFEWITRYPDFMDKAIPYVGTPRTAVSDRLSHTLRLQLIRQGWRCGLPQDSIIAQIRMFTTLMAHSPSYLNRTYLWPEMQKRVTGLMRHPQLSIPLPGYVVGLRAMRHHDVSAKFNHQMKLAAAAVKARCLIIVSLSDHLVNPKPALHFAKMLQAQTLVLNDDSGHLAVSSHMQQVSTAINKFLTN